MGELTYRSGIPNKHDLSRQFQNLSGDDDATAQISMVITKPLPGAKVECCYDESLVVGVVQFTRETGPDHFYVHHFSVLPSHQRNGIGQQLLERVQAVAHEEKLPIFVRNVSEVAARAFMKYGYWQVDGHEADPTLKWSDLPEHMNNDHP